MFTELDKALVAVVLGILSILALVFDWNLKWISEEGIMAVIAVLTPLLVYLVPNKGT
jgi:hypothetical protein